MSDRRVRVGAFLVKPGNPPITVDEIRRRWERYVHKTDSCWLWTANSSHGYGSLRIRAVSDGMLYAHRIAWQLFHGEIPRGLFVCHTCDNPTCCNPSHLFLGTPEDNSKDACTKGRQARGVGHGRHRLTDADVIEIRRLFSAGVTQAELVRRFNTAGGHISAIISGRRWTHITGGQPAQIADGVSPPVTNANARKTHCPFGHPLDGRNENGRRYCKTCNRERSRRIRQEKSRGYGVRIEIAPQEPGDKREDP